MIDQLVSPHLPSQVVVAFRPVAALRIQEFATRRTEAWIAFLKKNHMLVAVLPLGLAAVLYLLEYRSGAVAPLLAGVLVQGVAWFTLLDGGSGEGAGKERTH